MRFVAAVCRSSWSRWSADRRRTESTRGGSSPTRSADEADLIAALNQQPEDHLVEKRTWGAFWGTGLEQYLKERGVTQVVLTGCATSIGVDSTAREAYSCGFNVTIALDAVSDVSAEAHANCVTRIFPRISESGATEAVIGLLDINRG